MDRPASSARALSSVLSLFLGGRADVNRSRLFLRPPVVSMLDYLIPCLRTSRDASVTLTGIRLMHLLSGGKVIYIFFAGEI